MLVNTSIDLSYNLISGGKLAALEEFKVQKEDLNKKFEQMEEDIKSQADGHKDEIYKLEKKQVVDKDRYVSAVH